MVQYIRGMESTCALSMNMVRIIIKDCYRISKTGLKVTLVCYHLTISRMTVTGSIGHVPDLPSQKNKPCLNQVKPRFCNF